MVYFAGPMLWVFHWYRDIIVPVYKWVYELAKLLGRISLG